MNYKEFTKKSYGLEAKEVPPKPMTYADVKEDIRISDPKGSKKSEAEQYIDVYKDTHRGAPEIKNAKFREFTLSGKDEKLVADMVNKEGRFKEEVDLEEGKKLTDLTKHFDKKKFAQNMVVRYSLTADPDTLKRMTTNRYAKQLKKLDNRMGTMEMQGDKEDHLDFVKYMHDLDVKPTIRVIKKWVDIEQQQANC